MSLTVPSEYGYVILAATSTFVLNIIHSSTTVSYRRAAGVKYPIAYASEALAKEKPEAYLFNCAQRAHANFTENHPSVLVAMLLAGLHYPIAAAAMGFGWTLSRLLYLMGYIRPSWGANGRGRYKGAPNFLFHMGLTVLAAVTGVQLVMSSW